MPRLRALLSAALLVAALPAAATTVLRQSFDQLADGADAVVHGVVESVEARAVPGRIPFRLARVRVLDRVAGQVPAVIAIRMPGGADEKGRFAHVPGVPDLADGDEVLVFLERVPERETGVETVAPSIEPPGRSRAARTGGPQPREQWFPVGFAYGTWIVERSGSEVVAVRDPNAAGLHAVGDAAGEMPPQRSDLEEMKGRVRARRGGAQP